MPLIVTTMEPDVGIVTVRASSDGSIPIWRLAVAVVWLADRSRRKSPSAVIEDRFL
jgi:hypothetical protein